MTQMMMMNTSECSSETCNHIIGVYLDKINSNTFFESNDTGYTGLCKCVYSMNECITNNITEPLGLWLKNVYLSFYITLILTAFLVILITFVLILIDHKINPISKLKKLKNSLKVENKKINFNHIKPKTELNAIKTVGKNHIRKMNASSDFLILCLLLSYLIIILYVVPNQTYLFYFDVTSLKGNCKSTEFFKAFSVSFSIYCLVAVALQRLFAIKFGQVSVTRVNTNLIYPINYNSCFSFFNSLYDLLHAFLFSSYYKNYLITTLLTIIKWFISFGIGLYNMSLYNIVSTSFNDLDNDLFFIQLQEDCKPYFKNSLSNLTLTQFPTECSRNIDDENLSDIFFVVVLLLMPNLIVFSSYSWICWHVYSNSLKFKKSCEVIKQKNKLKKINSKKQIKAKEKEKEEINLLPLSRTTTSYNSNLIEKQEKIINNNNFNAIQLHTFQVLNTNSQISINKRNKSVILTTCLMVLCFTVCW
jgi:hypothetical protein